jgi:ABC-type antimicrobial peptide transport system permease subunit
MNSVLYKIFKKKLGIGAFLLSGLGLILGLSLVLIAIQIYVGLFSSFSDEIGKDNFLILNKDVNIANTLFNTSAVFSTEELAELQKQPFQNGVGLFTPNHYRVKAFAGGSLRFMTDLFFEAVPNQFIDNVPYDFEWHEGDNFIPIIVSDEFLNLYNYGFALSAGLPQVSRTTISLVPIQIEISGHGKTQIYKAKIVGFSERIATVLVPQQFMDWANKSFGNISNVPVSRVILALNKQHAAQAQQYLDGKNYMINSEKMASAKVTAITKIVMDVLIGIGMLFILFSFIIILMNFSIIVAEAKPDIILLLQLGYKPSHIVLHLFTYLSTFISSIAVISYLFFQGGYYYLVQMLIEKGIEIQFTFSIISIYVIVIFIVLMAIAGAFTIYRKVMNNTN